MDKDTLIKELQNKIIAALRLPDMQPSDLAPDMPLFDHENGLGLDSVDALELVVMLEKEYGLNVDDKGEAKNVFASINAMAGFIIQNREN